ncbi:tripartite tricarboxylate transporter substrate-binding protein [Eoetvoesiella caeni]
MTKTRADSLPGLPLCGRDPCLPLHRRRSFLGRAAGLALSTSALWQVSRIAMAGPLQAGLTFNATFPQSSGPGRFLAALSHSPAGSAHASVAQISPAQLPDRAADPQSLIVLSNQELFPPAGTPHPIPSHIAARLQPVAPLLVNPYFVVVGGSSGYQSMEQLLQHARQNPGAIRYGSWGAASLGHKYGAVLAKAAKADMAHVAYSTLSDLYAALDNNEVDWALGTGIGPAAAAHRAGLIRYLAIADAARDPRRDVPTMAESGGPDGIYFRAWLGLFAGAGAQGGTIESALPLLRAAVADPALRRLYPSMPPLEEITPSALQIYMQQEPSLLPRSATHYQNNPHN